MYEFFEENRKYRVVCTEDRNHCILVDHTPEEVALFAKEKNMTIVDTEPKYYVVHESTNDTLFMFAISSLVRRLAPFKPFDYLYGLFYRNKNTKIKKLVTKGVYLKKTEEKCPFVEVKDIENYIQLKAPKND